MKFLAKPFHYSFFLALFFFIISFVTLNDYGVSWDEVLHYRRAQAYLHYFLTGETDYKSLPYQKMQGTNGDPANIPYPRRSFYQSDLHNASYFFNDSEHPNINIGHPPVNGMIATVFNYIFYQKLGILTDINSNHLFNILASSILVFFVVYFAAICLNLFAATVAYLSLVLYPLFFAESHFNVKDPAETAFITGTIFCFYKSLENFSIKWLTLSLIFFGLGLGTKFNILFIPFIIVPYLLIRFGTNMNNLLKIRFDKRFKKYLATLLFLGPIIVILIVIPPWIYIWQDWRNIFNIIGYYEYHGTFAKYQPEIFYILGFNTFPIKWIFYTTPPTILFLSGLGIISTIFSKKTKYRVEFLWLLMLFVPIFRVTLPNTTVYGGVRQIMEFLPGLVLLASLGSYWLINITRQKNKISLKLKVIILVLFIYPALVILKLHPYQNVYFNSFIGGLEGAKMINFPSWGNSYGSAYLDGIKWLNQNSENDARLALIQGTPANAPLVFLRQDINLSNSNFSGIYKKGEYLMDLTFNDTVRVNNYAWEYVERFLNPQFELKVDNVAILKIWKNDLKSTIKDKKREEVLLDGVEVENSELIFPYEVELSRISISLPIKDCNLNDTYIYISKDRSIWIRKADNLGFEQLKNSNKNQDINFFFAGDSAKYLKMSNSCSFEDIPKIFVLREPNV